MTAQAWKNRASYGNILYDPENRIQAKYAGFYGVMCQHCYGYDEPCWRVIRKYNHNKSKFMLYCYRCQEWDEVKKERLGIER